MGVGGQGETIRKRTSQRMKKKCVCGSEREREPVGSRGRGVVEGMEVFHCYKPLPTFICVTVWIYVKVM